MIKVLSKKMDYRGKVKDNVQHFSITIKTSVLGWESFTCDHLWRVKTNNGYFWEGAGAKKITDADTLNEIQRLYNDYLKRNGGVE